jgi:hypothetical protein
MRIKFIAIKLLLIIFFISILLIPVEGYAQDGAGGTVIGKSYNTYLYASFAEDSSIQMSFKENMSLLVDAYDGFGLYLPVANLFFAIYWAPDYDAKKDLTLIITGAVFSDFIAGSGIALRDYQFHGPFLFIGYNE